MNAIAGGQGVGRIDIVEDRLVGIKSREVYESPAGIALIAAHEELENLTVERDVARYKRGVEAKWAELVYDGLWFSGLKRALDVFIDETQRYVTGDIRLKLHAGHRRRHRAAAATRACTTSTSPPTTPATRSTSRSPRASSSCGRCRARSRPVATSPASRDTVTEATIVARTAPARRAPSGAAGSPAGRRPSSPRSASRRTSTGSSRRTTSPARVRTPRRSPRPGYLTRGRARRHARGPRRAGRATSHPGTFAADDDDEDVHSALERGLIERAGPELGGKLRAGRSRNDQIATLVRLYLRDHAGVIAEQLIALIDAIAVAGGCASDRRSCPAAPTCSTRSRCCSPTTCSRTAGRWCATWSAWPTGTGARTSRRTAPARSPGRPSASTPGWSPRELGFARSVGELDRRHGGRDVVAEFAFVAAQIGIDLSRFAEEIILWNTREFGFVTLDDALLDRVVDHAAEEEPRHRRARRAARPGA